LHLRSNPLSFLPLEVNAHSHAFFTQNYPHFSVVSERKCPGLAPPPPPNSLAFPICSLFPRSGFKKQRFFLPPFPRLSNGQLPVFLSRLFFPPTTPPFCSLLGLKVLAFPHLDSQNGNVQPGLGVPPPLLLPLPFPTIPPPQNP